MRKIFTWKREYSLNGELFPSESLWVRKTKQNHQSSAFNQESTQEKGWLGKIKW